jgi:hypothetical protein
LPDGSRLTLKRPSWPYLEGRLAVMKVSTMNPRFQRLCPMFWIWQGSTAEEAVRIVKKLRGKME